MKIILHLLPIDRLYVVEVDRSWSTFHSKVHDKLQSAKACTRNNLHCSYKYNGSTISVDDEADFQMSFEILNNPDFPDLPIFTIHSNCNSADDSSDANSYINRNLEVCQNLELDRCEKEKCNKDITAAISVPKASTDELQTYSSSNSITNSITINNIDSINRDNISNSDGSVEADGRHDPLPINNKEGGFLEQDYSNIFGNYNPKQQLQEYLQKKGRDLPVYKEISREGPVHALKLTYSCSVEYDSALKESIGGGSSKKLAEGKAAAILLSILMRADRAKEKLKVGNDLAIDSCKIDSQRENQISESDLFVAHNPSVKLSSDAFEVIEGLKTSSPNSHETQIYNKFDDVDDEDYGEDDEDDEDGIGDEDDYEQVGYDDDETPMSAMSWQSGHSDFLDNMSEFDESERSAFSWDEKDRTSIRLVQPDCDPTRQGFAYAHATLFKLLNSSKLKWVSKRFSAAENQNLPQMKNPMMTAARIFCIELEALLHFCSSDGMKPKECIIWSTQSMNIARLINMISSGHHSASEVVKKFNFYELIDIDIVCKVCNRIFLECSTKQVQIRARIITPKINFVAGIIPSMPQEGTETSGRHDCHPSDVFPVGIYFNMTPSSFTSRRPLLMPPRSELQAELDEESKNEFEFIPDHEYSENDSVLFKPLKAASDPSEVQVIQSDASGTEGFGYVFSNLSDVLTSCNYKWISRVWSSHHPRGSFDQELYALFDFCKCFMETDKQIIWINDNQGAVKAINNILNENSYRENSIIAAIRGCLLRKNCTIVSRWIPRELNSLADHLSHLAHETMESELYGEESGKEGGRFPLGLYFCPQELFGKKLPTHIPLSSPIAFGGKLPKLRYQCKLCKLSFKNQQKLDKHQKNMPGHKGMTVIDVSGQMPMLNNIKWAFEEGIDEEGAENANSNEDLACNIGSAESGSAKYVCRHPMCSLGFTKWSTCRRHLMQSEHMGSSSFYVPKGSQQLCANYGKFKNIYQTMMNM